MYICTYCTYTQNNRCIYLFTLYQYKASIFAMEITQASQLHRNFNSELALKYLNHLWAIDAVRESSKQFNLFWNFTEINKRHGGNVFSQFQ